MIYFKKFDQFLSLDESFFNKKDNKFDNLYNSFKSIFLNLKDSIEHKYKMKFLSDNLKNDLIECKNEIITNYSSDKIKKIINVLKNIQNDIDSDLIGILNIGQFIENIQSIKTNKPTDHVFLKFSDTVNNYIFSLDGNIKLLCKYYEDNLASLNHYFPLKKLKIKNQISFKDFSEQLYFLQIELLKLQECIIKNKKKVLIIVEGRDAAGKGSTIEKFTEHLNPKYYRVETFGIPTNYEKENWFYRYEKVLPKKGEIVFFDRSWYNRAVIEPVMGYCSEQQYKCFMDSVNDFEKNIIENEDIQIIKFWLSVDKKIQTSRFELRKTNPLGYWKYSDNDEKVIDKWDKFTFYINKMLERTSHKKAVWNIIDSNDNLMYNLEAIKKFLNYFVYEEKILYEHKYDNQDKIIFLDINGVLIPEVDDIELNIKYFNDNNVWSKKAIAFMNEIIHDTHAKIVLVSSYRKIKTLKELQRRFSQVGIIGHVIGTISNSVNRGLGVEMWLKEHPNVENFVIIDDNQHHYIKLFKKEYIKPKHDIGIDSDYINTIKNILTEHI
jgi:polyphosphate kinase 2